jgi:hypothetical protein
MLGWAREVLQRLLRSSGAPLRSGEPSIERYNGQGYSLDHTDAFDRFLQDYKAHIDEEFEEHPQIRQPQPRRYGPPDSPSVPRQK